MPNPANSFYGCQPGSVIVGGKVSTPATSLTVTDTVHPRLYQRVGTAKTLMIGGSYTGPATRIQARACPAGTGLTALESTYPFSTVVTNPTGGTFSASLSVPQGDGLVVQVRDAIDHAVGSTGTHQLGAGSYIGLWGQSNMEQMFDSPSSGTPTGGPSALGQTAVSALQRIGVINDAFPPSTLSPVYGTYTSYGAPGDMHMHGLPPVYMANDLVAALGCPVALLLRAVSGSSINDWQAGQAYMNAALAGLTAVGGDCEAVIWLLGETDASTGMSAATHQAKLQNVFDTIRAATGRSVFPFGVVIVGPATDAWALAPERMGPIRKAQLDFIAANAANGAFNCGTDIDGDITGSTVHLTSASYLRQSYRYTEAIKRKFSGAAYGIEGPAITSASRSGNVITVNVQQHGGTALVGTGQQAFRVFDDGTPVAIDSSSVVGNTITLTLASTPSGVVTADYAMANAPFGPTTTPDEVCYDNQTIPGDTLGLPLQPKPLFTVT